MYDLIKRQFDQQLRESKPCHPEQCHPEPCQPEPYDDESSETLPILEPRYCIIAAQTQEEIRPKVSAIVPLIVLFVIAISLIVYGSIHINDCPAERMVAVSLIVLGSVTLISRLMRSPYDFREVRGLSNDRKNLAVLWFNAVLQIVIFCWFLSLCYWIFSMKPDTKPEDHGSSNYCAVHFYRFVFWGSIIGLVYFGVLFVRLVVLVEKYLENSMYIAFSSTGR